jgi:hypothetical protein
MRRILGILIGSTVALSAVGVATASANTVPVRPSSMGSWAAQTRDQFFAPIPANDPYCHNSVNFVTGPATPLFGSGSAELKTGDGTTGGDCSAELRNSAYSGVRLSSLTALSYWTYDIANNIQQFPYIELNIDTTGTAGAEDDEIFFEPPYQATGAGGADCAGQGATQMDTWQQWNALSGCWWWASAFNTGLATGSLSDYLALHPNATIVNSSSGGGIHLLVGFASPSDQFDGNVDGFTIGVSSHSTTYDFEPNLPVPTSKDQCKGNGWKNYAEANGDPFKNQGDCVSYVASKGKSK